MVHHYMTLLQMLRMAALLVTSLRLLLQLQLTLLLATHLAPPLLVMRLRKLLQLQLTLLLATLMAPQPLLRLPMNIWLRLLQADSRTSLR